MNLLKAVIQALLLPLVILPTTASTAIGEIQTITLPKAPNGFYCSATAWRVYRVLPRATATIEPIASTHRVSEQSAQNTQNNNKGILALFSPSPDRQLTTALEFTNGDAILINANIGLNGFVNFTLKMVTKSAGKVTEILAEHREVFHGSEEDYMHTPLSVSIPNIKVSNAYLRLGLSTLDDRKYVKLAESIQAGQLANGSITEANVQCIPK